jgi:hemoglobin-like flavoprotein
MPKIWDMILGRNEEEKMAEEPQSPWKATEPEQDTARVEPWGNQGEVPREALEDQPATGAHADPAEIIAQAREQRSFGEAPDLLTDSGIHRRLIEPEALREAPTLEVPTVTDEDDDVEKCEGCGRRMPTDYELIQASLEGVGVTDLKHAVAVPFYSRLFTAVPSLIPIFPPDMCYPLYDTQDLERITGYETNEDDTIKVNPKAGQIDLIVGAVAALANNFDRHNPAKMDALDRELAKLARSHIRFTPPAKIEEYAAVVTTLLAVLTDVLGARFDERTEFAWRKALEYASGKMLAGQAVAKMQGRGRRRREV